MLFVNNQEKRKEGVLVKWKIMNEDKSRIISQGEEIIESYGYSHLSDLDSLPVGNYHLSTQIKDKKITSEKVQLGVNYRIKMAMDCPKRKDDSANKNP